MDLSQAYGKLNELNDKRDKRELEEENTRLKAEIAQKKQELIYTRESLVRIKGILRDAGVKARYYRDKIASLKNPEEDERLKKENRDLKIELARKDKVIVGLRNAVKLSFGEKGVSKVNYHLEHTV